jgi:hypothetical protein
MPPPICGHIGSRSRRSFLKRSLAAGGAGTGMSLFTEPGAALAPHENDKQLFGLAWRRLVGVGAAHGERSFGRPS